MATAESVGVCTTMTGLPRRAGVSCCSHDAKKALRSRNSHWTRLSVADKFMFSSILRYAETGRFDLVLTMYGWYISPYADRRLRPSAERHCTMTEPTEPKSERVDLRMTPAAKRTLQRAAAVNEKTLTEFVLDSSLTAAFETLADRRVFQLDEVQWAAFMAALDMPPKDNPRLRKLLATRAPWDP